MIQSMTAFARYQTQGEWGILNWEIRTVNHRFLEMTFRLPELFRDLEGDFRELIKTKLHRGKIDCILNIEENQKITPDIQIKMGLAKALVKACHEISDLTDAKVPIDPLRLLNWPGVIEISPKIMEPIRQISLESFQNVLNEVIQQRQREGSALKEALERCLQGIEQELEKIVFVLPEISQLQHERLQQAFQSAKLEIDQTRLEQELVLILQKIDIQEEIDRLHTHIEAMKLSLKKGTAEGRYLNFLIQELHREVNTIGSKSISLKTSQASLAMKVFIEQMREQIQNIE